MIAKALLRSGLQSGTIMGIADLSTQILIEGKGLPSGSTTGASTSTSTATGKAIGNEDYDAARTLRWAFLGLALHGPYFFLGFSFLDKKFASAGASAKSVVSWRTVAKKTVAAQCFLFPPYLVALFGVLGMLEGNPDVPGKIQKRVPEAFVSGCVYWPIANSINFKLVPNTMRVPYLALSAGAWNSYLSYTNQCGDSNTR